MASKRLALIGTQSGPWIHAVRLRRPQLHVRGSKGKVVCATMRHQDGDVTFLEFSGDGLFDLPRMTWVRVSCPDAPKSLVCAIISEAA